ncbi:MAG: P1 family peptidase [Chloroflexota bacterium]
MDQPKALGARRRARDFGLVLGQLTPGPNNAITDVAGVRVGHVTLIAGDGALVPGKGPVRTGVTAILPHSGNLFRQRVVAAVHTINGFGKPCGFEQVRELGVLETPIILTNTLNVGVAFDALVSYMIQANPDLGITADTVGPVVGETNDGYLNDLQGRHVKPEHVFEAIQRASAGPVAEGCVGAGTGTIAFGFKAGIGTASRRLPPESGGFTVGALVQANFGAPKDLTIAGARVGRALAEGVALPHDRGSAMVVLATDAPCSSRQLGRLARRAVIGLARTGGASADRSGEFVVAFSTTNLRPRDGEGPAVESRPMLIGEAQVLPTLFQGVIESAEEAVVNALLRAEPMTGRDGHLAPALPIEPLRRLLGLPDL